MEEEVKKKIEKALAFDTDPELAMFKEITDIQEKIDEILPVIKSVDGFDLGKLEMLQGEQGEKGERGEGGTDGLNGKDGADGKNGIDGKNGQNGEDGMDGLNGKDGKDGKNGSPDNGEQIIEKINSTDEKKVQIDAKHIKGLPQFTREIVREVGGRAGAYETPITDSNGALIAKDAQGRWKLPAQAAGGVTSVSATDSTLTISPTTGAVLAGLNLANANAWSATQTYTKTSPTAATVYDGFYLNNQTAATAGNQQYSGALHFTGQGWKTTVTAGSQSVDVRNYLAPVQGTTTPTFLHTWVGAVNGGAYSTLMTLDQNGQLTTGAGLVLGGSITIGNSFVPANGIHQANGYQIFTVNGQEIFTASAARFGIENGTPLALSAGGEGASDVYFSRNAANIGQIGSTGANASGKLLAAAFGAGLTSAPTALVHMAAGTATASTAPMKFTSGTNLTVIENGATEYNGTHLYISIGGVRYQLDQQGVSNYAHTIFTPTTGQTVTLINNQYNIVNPAGALLALTVNLPSTPANNDVVYIKFTQNVTTVTYANGTVVDGITAPTAGGLTVLVYDSGTTSWY